MYDLRSRSDIESCLDVQAIAASGSVTGETIDTQDHESLDLCFNLEVTTGAPVTVTLYEGDAALMTDEEAVDSTNVIGTATLSASATGTQVIHLGYVGYKRYVRAKFGTTGAPTMDVAGIAFKSKAKHCPTV